MKKFLLGLFLGLFLSIGIISATAQGCTDYYKLYLKYKKKYEKCKKEKNTCLDEKSDMGVEKEGNYMELIQCQRTLKGENIWDVTNLK